MEVFAEEKAASPNRELGENDEDVSQARRRNVAQKNAKLELMLGHFANNYSEISRNSIIKSTS